MKIWNVSVEFFLHWHYNVSDTVMDARNMDVLPNECFDCIIDKGIFNYLETVFIIK